jgi:lipopolysaccharide export system permease protein
MRLLRKSLVQQVRQVTGAIFMILFMIVLIFMILKVLNYANQTQGAENKLFFILPLSLIVYLPHLLIGSVFLGVISTLNRWYQNHEMQVWMSLGLALRQFIPLIIRAVIPFFFLLFAIVIWAAPWGQAQLSLIKNQTKQQQDLSFFLSGEFFEIGPENQKKVLFVESINTQSKELSSVFVNQIDIDPEKIDIITAKQVKIENKTFEIPDSTAGGATLSKASGNASKKISSPFATLENGVRHMANLQRINGSELDLKSLHFQQLTLPIQPKKAISPVAAQQNVREQTTSTLLRKYKEKTIAKNELAELLWRFSLPFSILVLPVLALALTHQQVRKTRYWPMVLGVVLYFAYNNMINLLQTMIEKGRLEQHYVIFILHGAVFIFACLLIFYRSQGYLYFKSRLFKSRT